MNLNEAFMVEKDELSKMSIEDLESKIKSLQQAMMSKEPLHVQMETKCKQIDKKIELKESRIKEINNEIKKIIGDKQKIRQKRNNILKKYQSLNNQIWNEISHLRQTLHNNNNNNNNNTGKDNFSEKIKSSDINRMKQKCEKLFIKYRDFSDKYQTQYQQCKQKEKEQKSLNNSSESKISSLLHEQCTILYEIMNHYSEYSNIYEQFVNRSLNFQIYNQLIYLLKQILFRKQQNFKRQETLNQARMTRNQQSNEAIISEKKRNGKRQILNQKLQEINIQLKTLSMDQSHEISDVCDQSNKNTQNKIVVERKVAAIDRLTKHLKEIENNLHSSTNTKCIKHTMDIYDDFDMLEIDHIPIFQSDIPQCLQLLNKKRESM